VINSEYKFTDFCDSTDDVVH